MLLNCKNAVLVLLLTLFLSNPSMAQTLNFQAGTSYSQLDWNTGVGDWGIYNQTYVAFNGFVGLDYLHRHYCNLSSNIGVVRKGGQSEVTLLDETGELTAETKKDKATLDYVTLNTLFELKYPIKERLLPFLSAGPRIDFLLNSSKEFKGLKEMDALNNISYGLLLGGGVKYNWENLQLGLRADYYLDFNKLAEWPAEPGNLGGEVTGRAFTVNLVVGYRLR